MISNLCRKMLRKVEVGLPILFLEKLNKSFARMQVNKRKEKKEDTDG